MPSCRVITAGTSALWRFRQMELLADWSTSVSMKAKGPTRCVRTVRIPIPSPSARITGLRWSPTWDWTALSSIRSSRKPADWFSGARQLPRRGPVRVTSPSIRMENGYIPSMR
ncbi:hypothetical protein D3C76_1423850 [compost metagenome]